MMAGWRRRKRAASRGTAARIAAAKIVAAMIMAALIGGAAGPAAAATNEQIVSDPHTGLAISGYDPVAYFTDAQARPGLASLERGLGGVVWRFRNEGNRAAFIKDPEVYMPQFGGYDPVAVARGASAPGHPELWLVIDSRLYLFYDAKARAAFAADPAQVRAEAERHWPQVRDRLAR